MSKITLERYFYPVGQGLCCRERFIFNDDIDPKTGNPKEFNLVYDCGSGMRKTPEKNVRQVIEKNFSKVHIDCIFISHFYRDHTNLLDTLKQTCSKINIILIPFKDDKEINLFLVADSDSDEKLLHSIKYGNYDGIELADHDTLYKFLPNKLTQFWKYSHTNYKYITQNKSFLNALSKNNIDISKLQYFDYVNQDEVKKILTKIYSYLGELNEQSTVLASFPTKLLNNINGKTGFESAKFDKEKIGSIYFGDYPLHDYHSDIETFMSATLDKIGTIQVPHHGSNTGLYPPLYQNNKVYTISCGINNRYRHPTKGVVFSITAMDGSSPICITEYSNQYYMQTIEFDV